MNIQSQSKLITPQQLYQKLLSSNYKQIQCIDQIAYVKQQKSILISLINQYRQEIQKKLQKFDKLQKLVNIRNALRIQLQKLRNDRIAIDHNIINQIQRINLSPIQIAQKSDAGISIQIQKLRIKNQNLQRKLIQLSQYALKVDNHNIHLSKQNQIRHQSQISRLRSSSSIPHLYYGGHQRWRQSIRTVKNHQDSISRDITSRLRQRQQESQMRVKLQEEEIAQRNRKRMASFHQKFRKGF